MKIPPLTIVVQTPDFEKVSPLSETGIKTRFGQVLFLGEIHNSPGHCVIVDDKGKVHWGWHTERFIPYVEAHEVITLDVNIDDETGCSSQG